MINFMLCIFCHTIITTKNIPYFRLQGIQDFSMIKPEIPFLAPESLTDSYLL